MAGSTLEKFGLASLARATQSSLDWRKWGQSQKRRDFELQRAGPSREVLDKLIEAEIIPRLMLVNREAAAAAAPVEPESLMTRSFDADEIDAFARRAVAHGADDLAVEVTGLLGAGVSHEDILLKLLAPAARRLGQYWDEDLCDFTEVTIGLMKLHRVLEHVRSDAPSGMGAGSSAPRVLLSPAPGEQHVFGIVMVGEFFARSGWRVRCESSAEEAHLLAAVSDEFFDVVGLSASSDISLKALSLAIRRIRTASLNPDVAVLVGGQLFNADLGLARRIGADATATDGVRAVVTAERLVQRLARKEEALQQ